MVSRVILHSQCAKIIAARRMWSNSSRWDSRHQLVSLLCNSSLFPVNNTPTIFPSQPAFFPPLAASHNVCGFPESPYEIR